MLAVLYVVPLTTERQFARGQSQVLSIQASQAEPTPQTSVRAPADVQPLSLDSQIDRMFEYHPPQRDVSEPLDRLNNKSNELPPAHAVELPPMQEAVELNAMRREREQPVPEVATTNSIRPRRERVSDHDPVVTSVPLQFAGVEKDSLADLSSNQPPAYPADALARKLEGVVLLELTIDDQGQVVEVIVLRSSGHRILDRTAVDAVSQWRGTPAKRWGRPVESTERLPIRFRL